MPEGGRTSIDFRQELPRHDTGKIYTRLLKSEYLSALSASNPAMAQADASGLQ